MTIQMSIKSEVVLKYFGILMTVVYEIIGIALLTQPRRFSIPPQYTVPLGIALMGYGVLRGYRVYQKYYR
ncbi:MAG: hypothetical protein C0490_10055 [Marivirga sp.]|nr:hypothetical protein [Marivirga sp.]